jgi:hypothetical protein
MDIGMYARSCIRMIQSLQGGGGLEICMLQAHPTNHNTPDALIVVHDDFILENYHLLSECSILILSPRL